MNDDIIGAVGFVWGNGILGKIISEDERMLDRVSINLPTHTFLVIDKNHILQAIETGVQITQWPNTHFSLYPVPRSLAERKDAIDKTRKKYLHAWYGYFHLFAFVPIAILSWIAKIRFKNIIPGPVCSTIVAYYLQAFPNANDWIDIFKTMDTSQATPADIYLLFVKNEKNPGQELAGNKEEGKGMDN